MYKVTQTHTNLKHGLDNEVLLTAKDFEIQCREMGKKCTVFEMKYRLDVDTCNYKT